jgi:hypothetical protein
MPSTSKKQHKFMAAVANNPAFAKKAGVPQSVGKEFTAADKKLKLPKSGSRADLQKVNSPKTNQGANELFKKGGSTMATKMNPGFMAMMAKKKDGAKGDMPAALAKHAAKPASKAHAGLKAGGSTGSFRASANGIAQRGKTKAMMPKMNKGGKAC